MLKYKSFLVGLILIILLGCLLFIMPFANQQLHLDRFDAMAKCFDDKQIPCRWVPGLENFYGSPVFGYTAPLAYYFGGLVFLILGNLSISVKIIFSVGLIGSYIFIYLFANKLFANKFRASLSAFSLSVVVFLAFFDKEGLGIAWGMMFPPLTFLSFSLFSLRRTIKNFLFSSVSLSLLILSADLTAVFIGMILLWLILMYIHDHSFTFLLLGLSSIIFAFLLSSFYVFPSILERNLVHSVSMNDPYRYLPKSAAEKPQIATETPYEILTGDSDIANFKQGTNWLRFETNTKTHTIIRLSGFYFPQWKIFIDGKEIKVEYKDNSLGLMTIIVGKGNHIVEGRLFDTPIRSISNLITIISSISALLLWISQLKGISYWLSYYRKRIN